MKFTSSFQQMTSIQFFLRKIDKKYKQWKNPKHRSFIFDKATI